MQQSHTQPQPQYVNASQLNETFQRQVLDKLSSLDQRLTKLDSIEKHLTSLATKITSIDTRVTSLESSAKVMNSKVVEVEASRAYDTQSCDELKDKQSQLEESLRTERERVKKYAAEVSALKSLPDDLDDLRSRSMRNNLLFHGFEECRSVK